MSTPPPPPEGYYPQQPYYAPGWQQPVPEGPPPPRDRRRRRVVLASVAGVLVVAVLAGGVVGLRAWLGTRPLGDVDRAMTVGAQRLGVGHCVAELPDDGTVDTVDVVPCDDAHAAEVLGVRKLTDDAWPGQDVVDAKVAASCEMDTSQTDAGFVPVVWAPSEAGWARGDREGLCLAWLDGGGVRGSFTAGDDVTTP
ncbi:septum formation family protein [Actinotalea subterranea]|uniref:septum formation family protein n=1 Tax=Actinotalea subterranea TaxID=2607497 RepID=UPI0011F01D68|nr:septum formation family protein [Actinotalea subterranea]